MKELINVRQLSKKEQLKVRGGARKFTCEFECDPIPTHKTEKECTGPGYHWVGGICYLCCY